MGESKSKVRPRIEPASRVPESVLTVTLLSCPEPGTPASRLDGHLTEELKQERRDRLMEAQQEVAFAWSRRQLGKELEVIVDGPDPEVPNHALGRSYADAPDIDGLVRVKGKRLHAGDVVRVKVTGADGYDLAARAVGAGG